MYRLGSLSLVLALLIVAAACGTPTPTSTPWPTPTPTATTKPTPTSNVLARNTPASPTTTIIGRWRDNRLGVEQSITIRKRGDVLYLDQEFSDGSKLGNGLTEEQRERYVVRGNPNETYVINRAGDLEIWDSYGLITTARKIR